VSVLYGSPSLLSRPVNVSRNRYSFSRLLNRNSNSVRYV
jgi:hypothetical protein